MNTFSAWDIIPHGFGDSGHSHLLQALIRRGLKKLLTSQEEDFLSALPLLDMEIFSGEMQVCSISLICQFSPGIEKFFSEMLSRWLLPEQRMVPDFFLHTTFSFAQSLFDKFSFCEMRFSFSNEHEEEGIRKSFFQLSSEIKLGSMSPYQAHKVLEHRGLFSSEKNSLIRERVASLIHRRPEDFDYDIFGQMQHFFLSCREDFKQIREHAHLSRIVYVFYLFRKRLRKVMEKAPDKRHVSFKAGQIRLHQPFGIQRVLGVFIGMNFLKKHELFEERHVLKALQEHLPDAHLIEGSLFVYLQKEEGLQILYLEIQKQDGRLFSPLEIQNLRNRFPKTLEHQVEKLMPTLFMPRNEEEVMKNIIRLSQELKYLKDIPQVFISFEEQTDVELTFTVVLVRVLLEKTPALRDLFFKKTNRYVFIEDRMKHIGLLRGKYPKEATVFRLKLPKAYYVRADHSVDLLKAREAVSLVIQDAVGEFRDYNGGMIAKQTENLQALKSLILLSTVKEEVELEEFFHSIHPMEMRAVVEPILLKIFYELWQQMAASEEDLSLDFSFLIEGEGIAFMTRFTEEEVHTALFEGVKDLQLSSSKCLFFSMKTLSVSYLGFLLLGVELSKGEQLLDHIQKLQNRFCFSL
jgi:hypothetical protein